MDIELASWTVKDLSLKAIAESGQVFTWKKVNKGNALSWRISSGAKLCMATQTENVIRIVSLDGRELGENDLSYWHHYLALDDNYPVMLTELRASGLLNDELYAAARGIRILHQKWWDVAVSFVISQNSNIIRIQHTMDELMALGKPVGTVPSPCCLHELLTNPDICTRLRLGYREQYLRELSRRAAAGWSPLALKRPYAPLDVQMRELEELPGIGAKVASCICLYGLGYLNAVPRDVWIKRAEENQKITWHPRLGGIQQQFIFSWIRGEQAKSSTTH